MKSVFLPFAASFFSVNAFALVPRERCHQARSLLSDQCRAIDGGAVATTAGGGQYRILNDQAM